ncbi:MAG: DUF4395 domain-containing protein [Gammaproteobacteria bacterium]|nr:DUF4395 domain-containing protein [Gammaproteobacteria bacterium]MDH5729690.1 DUF4395 domain-containing protein [Gammaproteobacteria bacterium]
MVINKFRKHWFQTTSDDLDSQIYINERAVRARAGLLFLVPVILLFIRIDHGNHDQLVVDTISNSIVEREYSHFFAHSLIFFVMYEMAVAMFVKTSHLSFTSLLGVMLTYKQKPIYQPMQPKVVAWIVGLVLAILCQISLYYTVMQYAAFYFLSACLLFMWLESACGICVGCKFYNVLAKAGLIRKICDVCHIENRDKNT